MQLRSSQLGALYFRGFKLAKIPSNSYAALVWDVLYSVNVQSFWNMLLFFRCQQYFAIERQLDFYSTPPYHYHRLRCVSTTVLQLASWVWSQRFHCLVGSSLKRRQHANCRDFKVFMGARCWKFFPCWCLGCRVTDGNNIMFELGRRWVSQTQVLIRRGGASFDTRSSITWTSTLACGLDQRYGRNTMEEKVLFWACHVDSLYF